MLNEQQEEAKKLIIDWFNKKEKPYLGKVYNLVTRAEYVGSIISSFINMVKEIRISSQYDRFNRKKIEKVVCNELVYKKIYSYKEYLTRKK